MTLADFITEVKARAVPMSAAVSTPMSYRVKYTLRVRQRLLALAEIARDGAASRHALRRV